MSDKLLRYFMRTYFHQDWMEEFTSATDVVRDFALNESKDTVRGLISEINVLLASETISERYLIEIGGNYSPEVDGLSASEWLEAILAQVEKSEISQNQEQ
ncbi:hypothetical protein AHAT_30160 [Agarivorans sp. Toyoura001]|nr:hypothetical protein AHAT_30160 [Agarivorans sp. Toyoura001]